MAKRHKTAIKSIREYCVKVCTAGDQEWVRECPDGIVLQGKPPCPLWPYRMGTNPNISEKTRERKRQAAISRNFGSKDCVHQ